MNPWPGHGFLSETTTSVILLHDKYYIGINCCGKYKHQEG